jgi:2,3-bisphosphoglycerate-independent phosphoglycerate mutase
MLYDFSKTFGEIIRSDGGKIIFVVLDGLGGIPYYGGKTELEAAKTPNLDRLAKESAKGLHIPVEFGVTPGSGPSHLALFGYDPVKNIIKRGIMEALGIGITPSPDEIVARGNFAKCSEDDGKIKVLDRRAGRISTEINKNLCSILSEKIKMIEDVEVKFYPVKEHRVCISLKGKGLSDEIGDTDPQKEGEYIRRPQILGEDTYEKRRTADIVEKLTFKIFEVLRSNEYAQCILLRGFSKSPDIESFEKRWKLKALAIATYPMYRGIAKILGMNVAELDGENIDSQIRALKNNFEKYDFFYFHFKKTDSRGEDGDFEGKVKAIEEFDSIIPEILSLNPEVLTITGDHSSPSALAGHSFHPVPIMIWSKRAFKDGSGRFTERDCRYGSLGLIYAVHIMPLLLAHAGRLEKFGA